MIFQIMVGLSIWHFVGAVVLTLIDRDKQLIKWVNQAPNFIYQGLVLTFWPIVAFFYLTK